MVMAQFRKFCLRVTVIITLVFLPIFTLFSYADEDTGYAQTYQYGWSISMGFIKGESAAVVVAVMWSALLIYCMHFEATFIDRTPISITASPILHAKLTSDSMSSITAAAATAATAVTAAASATTIEVIDSVDKVSEDKQCNEGVGVQDEDEPEILPTPVVVSVPALWRKALVVTANILGTLAANSLYVWIVLTQSLVVQVIAAACFVVYKLLFMYLVLVPWMERVESKFIVILSVVLMNFIIIPMLATLAMDVSCFESLFVQAPPIVTDYSYLSCSLFTGATIEDATCADYRPIELQLSIPAPFIYSDMCFTAVLTNYVPIYVLTYGVIGLLVPVIQIVTTIHFANAAVTQDQKMLAWIHKMKTIEWFPIFYLFPLESIHDMVAPDNTIKKHFYLSRFNSLNCVLLLTILLSFGATYSPLAIMVLLNITLTTLAFQLSIYYHSQQIRLLPVECMEPWSAVLTAEIRDMHKIVFGSRTAIYIFSSLFVACGVYEMSEILNFPLTISLMVGVIVVAVVGTRVLKYRRATALQQYNQMVDTVSKRRRSSTGGNSARVSRGDINDGVGNGGVFDSGDKRINDSTNDVSIELAGICTATVTADGGSCDNDSVDCVDDVDVIINPLCAAPTDDVEPAAVLQ